MKGYSTDDKKKKIEALSARLDSGIKDIFTSDKYKQMLDVMSKFHNYSANNCVLIAMQKPDASRCAGFNKWKELGRSVKRGEKGIQILAPMFVKQKDEDGNEILDPKTNKPKQVIIGFKPGYVFDISQTEGKELPTIAERLTGDVYGFDTLKEALIKASAVPVEFKDIKGEVNGYYSPGEGKIVVKDSLSEEHTIKTLVHEIAHSRMHGADDGLDRQTEEVQAESVAYIVSGYLGIDASAYSFGYVAGWSKTKELDELKSSLDVIKKTASEIIDKVESYTVTVEQPSREEVAQIQYEVTTEKKYELTDETLLYQSPLFAQGVLLHRIRALKDFSDVRAGDLGGFIESEKNLSHEGSAWVFDRAKVYEDAYVHDNARVGCGAEVFGRAFVGGDAYVYDNALVAGDAKVFENAIVCGNATVSENAAISGKAYVREDATVDGSASVSGYAEIRGKARVSDYAVISDHAKVYGHALVNEYARVCDRAVVSGEARVFGKAVLDADMNVFGNISFDKKAEIESEYTDFKEPVNAFKGTFKNNEIERSKEKTVNKDDEYEQADDGIAAFLKPYLNREHERDTDKDRDTGRDEKLILTNERKIIASVHHDELEY